MKVSFLTSENSISSWSRSLYSVFHYIWTQEWGCCELALALLMVQRVSMWPQDWAQITFRSEMHSNNCNNESGRLLEKLKNQDLVIWAWYTVGPKIDSCFNHPLLTPCNFDFWPSGLLKRRNFMWMYGCLGYGSPNSIPWAEIMFGTLCILCWYHQKWKFFLLTTTFLTLCKTKLRLFLT